MKQVDIVGLGEIVIDWVTEIPHFPKPDEKINALSENYFPGGVTANYLVATARLGGRSGFIGAVGYDSYGDYLVEDFVKENVDITCIKKIVDKKTPVNFIFLAQGEKTIIQSPHMQTTKIEIEDLSEDYISNSKLLHTTVIHQEVTEKAIEIAKQNDVRISIDLESQIAVRGWSNLKNVLMNADILLPNKEGAKFITNCSKPEKAAQNLVNKGIPIVIITLGHNGVLITTKEFQKAIPSYEVKNVIDTTGAGDTFNGAFSLAYWIKGWDLEKSCKYANAAAALKIQKLGARPGMPNEIELIDFLKKNEESYF
ncbi:MAG: carbohydrate kinase family protein [Candidatus Lokiarchaeota archaeon]|nr:carbohydrate kinase family protein [Candidatus Lokiarchaeota archaeon]